MQELLLLQKPVLIVEDNSINQLLVKNLVERIGALVDFASTGFEAVEKMKGKSYDLVLMDIQLPEMDGYEISAFIRNELKSEVPIIAMTAFAINGEDRKCFEYGMNAYVAKPFSQKDLYDAIEKVLSSQKATFANPHILNIKDVAVDISMLYEVAGDDASYINAMVSTFLDTIPGTLKKMEESLSEKNYEALYKFAHYAKSSLSVIKVSDAYNIAEQIERKAKSQVELSMLPSLLETLKSKCSLAEKVLLENFSGAIRVT